MLKWIVKTLTSSLGKKLVMSLTGIFLILFLIVHLVGNLQLLSDDGGESFNIYAYFMTTNPLIKTVSYGLYLFILIHTIQGIALKIGNRSARGVQYAVSNYPGASWASKQMALLGILIFAFLCIHMGDFWFKMKFTDQLTMQTYEGYNYAVKDLYAPVQASFEQLWIVIVYIVGQVALALHLWHGFDSAFQTLGLRHTKFGPLFRTIGRWYSVLVPLGFAIIPLYFFIFK